MALRAIATSVTGEVGGLSLQSAPVGWKQAQGTFGSMQATLYGQIKALRLEILQHYDVDLSVHSALFTWLVRHAQWRSGLFTVTVTFATRKAPQLLSGVSRRQASLLMRRPRRRRPLRLSLFLARFSKILRCRP